LCNDVPEERRLFLQVTLKLPDINLPDMFFAIDAAEDTAGRVVEKVVDAAREATGSTRGILARASDLRLHLHETLEMLDPYSLLSACGEITQGCRVMIKPATP
jgi:hypothetical protein